MIKIPTPWGVLQFVMTENDIPIIDTFHKNCACKICSISQIRNTYACKGYRLKNFVDFYD
jgi:hypothetical protein